MAWKIMHAGRRRFWSGKVDTLCGLVIENAQKSWWSGVNCSACKHAKSGR